MGEADPPDLPRLEEQVGSMGPLIDAELERVDRRHAQLTRLSHELVDALSLYHTLMREMPGMPAMGPGMSPYPGMYPGYGAGMQPGPPMQGGMMGYVPQQVGPQGGPPPGMPVQSMGGSNPMGMPGQGQQMMGQPMGGPPVSASMPMHQQNGGMPPHPGMYGYMDPSMYHQQQQHFMSMPPGTAPPPTPPLQEQQAVQPGQQM